MTSFDYCLNPLYPIKECSSCGGLYTTDYCCSVGILEEKIICDLDKTPDLSQRSPQNCPKCGHPVNGHYCQGCALLRKKFKKDLFTSGIFYRQCTCELCGNSDHYGYNCPPKVPIIPDPEPFNNQTIKKLPPTMQSFDPKSDLVHNSPNVFDPPPQLPFYSCEFCRNDARYGHYCTPQVPRSKKIYLNPLFDDEIISMKIDLHHFNAESDLIDSLLNHDSSIISSSSKIGSIFDEFVGELTFLKSISSGIDETDCDPEEEIRLIEKLLYDNSSPRPPKEFVFGNSDAKIKSFSPSHIPVKDSDFLMEEIDLSFTSDYPMPPGIEDDDYDSERDILILKDSLSNDNLSLLEIESFHFDIPSFSRPLAKPPDGNT
nr:hypothetical protein [Tanacetum cinerariifolium]